MKKFTQPNGMMIVNRSSGKFSLALSLICGMMFISEFSHAQLIRSKERLALRSEHISEQKKEQTSRKGNTITYNDVYEYNAEFENDFDYNGYSHSQQFVFDNLPMLKRLYTIPDIFFDLDQSVISQDARDVLDHLALLLTTEQDLDMVITAHSDTRIAAYNNVLSLQRANAARIYLIAWGVLESRIVIDIHGRRSIKNPCTDNPGCSIEEQKINRRTEFNIIYNNVNLAHVHAYDE